MIAQVTTPIIDRQPGQQNSRSIVKWEPLPQDFKLEDDPVDDEGQPLLAGALRESLEREVGNDRYKCTQRID